MDKIDIILWILSGGFALIFGLMVIMWHSLNARINDVEERLGARIDKLDIRFDKLDEKVTDIDRRMCRMEGALTSKDCCMLKDDRSLRKAE